MLSMVEAAFIALSGCAVFASPIKYPIKSIDKRLSAIERQVEAGALPLWVFHNQELYDLELERIFGGGWIFMAHETEIPDPGDYVARSIGNDPFIVVRGHDNVVRVLFDSCRHRGARLCVADKGNAKSFFCPYHGWTISKHRRSLGCTEHSHRL